MEFSPKQKERARQTFMKSAQYAGFIDTSTGRFVKPGIAQKDEGQRQQDKPADNDRIRSGGGGGDENPPTIDPIIEGLLKRLPKTGDVWPEDDRKLWLQLLEGSFKLIYKDAAPVLPPPPGDAEYRKSQGLPPRGQQSSDIFK